MREIERRVQNSSQGNLGKLQLPEVPGWSRVAPQHSYPWQPAMTGADRVLAGSYRDRAGHRVDVVYALYAVQEDGREAGGHGATALVPGSDWRWLAPAAPINGAQAERLQALGTIERLALSWYRHDGWTGGSRTRLKLVAMRDRLLLRARPTAMLILSAEGAQARPAISAFADAIGPQGEWMDRIGGID